MIQIKDRKNKYRNTNKKDKATSCTRGFLDSKIYEKPMNLTKTIIRQNGKNHTIFLRKLKSGGEDNG